MRRVLFAFVFVFTSVLLFAFNTNIFPSLEVYTCRHHRFISSHDAAVGVKVGDKFVGHAEDASAAAIDNHLVVAESHRRLFNHRCEKWLSGGEKEHLSRRMPLADEVGFVMTLYDEVNATIRTLESIRAFFPRSPIAIDLDSDSDELYSQYDPWFRKFSVTNVRRMKHCLNASQAVYNSRPFFQYTCSYSLDRMYDNLVKYLNSTPWICYVHVDTRFLAPLAHIPMADVNTVNNVQNTWNPRFLDYIRLLEPHHSLSRAQHITSGYGFVGGAFFRRDSFLCALSSPLFLSRLEIAYSLDPRISWYEDACMEATFLVAGYDVAQWSDLLELKGGARKCPMCVFNLSLPLHEHSYKCSNFCPSIVHSYKKDHSAGNIRPALTQTAHASRQY